MGSTVILIGVALLVLPGPGWAIIFAGLAILGTEFAFARVVLIKARQSANGMARSLGVSERFRCWMGLCKRPAHGTPQGADGSGDH